MRNEIKIRRVFPNFLIVGFLIMSLALPASPAIGADPKEELKKRNIKFDVDSFAKHAGKGDLEAVKLFLDAGMDPNAKSMQGWMALTLASRKGHSDVVELLLKNGADPNVKNEQQGETALLIAVYNAYTDIVKLLLENGADPNVKDMFSDAVLIIAYNKGNLGAVELLLKNGADTNTKNNNGDTILIMASRKGHTDTVKLLLEKGADVHAKAIEGMTALGGAAKEGHTEIAKLLIEKGADLNVRSRYESPAITEAARSGHYRVVRLLVEKGANINAKDKYGRTALESLISSGNVENIRWLLDKGAEPDAVALWRADQEGNVEIIKLLLENGADTMGGKALGNTLVKAVDSGDKALEKLLLEHGGDLSAALFYAVVNNKVGTAKRLLNRGANPEGFGDDGHMALTAAAEKGDLELVRLLIEHNADVNTKGAESPPLIFAAKAGNFEMVKFLVEQGADVNALKTGIVFGFPPALISAVRKQNAGMVKYLLQNGADPNIRSAVPENEDTPLYAAIETKNLAIAKVLLDYKVKVNEPFSSMYGAFPYLEQAARGGQTELAYALLEHEADINAPARIYGDPGNTPLMSAAEGGHISTVRLLLKRGANVNSTNKHGMTALDIAKKEKHNKIVKLLSKSRPDNSLVIEIIEQGKVKRLDLLLSGDELRGIDKTGLRIIRNSILARYGYPFKSKDLQTHFSQFSWYKPTTKEEAGKKLTDTDKKNIQTIQSIEKGQ